MPNNSKKYPLLVMIIVAALIIILPAGSWWYLQQGLDYRKELLSELEVKDNLSINEMVEDSTNYDNPINGFTTVLVSSELSRSQRISDIADQFENAYTFKIVEAIDSIATRKSGYDFYDLSKKGIHGLFTKNQIYLIDKDGDLRSSYDGSDSCFDKLVEHIAVVLPRTPEKDIKMKK